MEFLNSQDIKLNLLHEREMSIARANKGVGNLHLSVDERGVNFEFEAPRCDLGNRALELIRAGVYSGCSFEFMPQDYDVTERGEDVLITHTKFRAITALTLGMDPAYLQTSLHARELYDQTPAGIADKKAEEEQRKREEQEKAEAMKKEMQRRLKHLQRMADFDEKLESSTF